MSVAAGEWCLFRWLALTAVVAGLMAQPAVAQTPEGEALPPVEAAPVPPAPVTPIPAPSPAPAPPPPGAATDAPPVPLPKALRQGALLIHGNYCGVGNRPGKPPIDAIDAACMRHDACTVTGKLPNCACNDRLRIEATAIVEDPRQPPDVKAVAAATAASMALLICKIAPREAAPR